MQKPAKGADAFRVSAVIQLEGGSVYAAAPVRFEGARNLVAQRDSDDIAFPMVVLVAPPRAANEIVFMNRIHRTVMFTLTRGDDQLGALGEVEVGPGETHHMGVD